MPIDPGTLAGFDQLLSISQEAINRQLQVLYLTEVDPPLIDGPTHLINHEMHFHFKREVGEPKKVITAREGLDAYVCCPKIEFGGQSISDDVDKYRLAIIRFKFRRAEDWENSDADRQKGKRDDSVFIYKQVYDQDEEGNDKYEYPEVVINGWEISWVALIDRKDIQDVFQDIIEPASSPSSNVSLSEGVRDQLKTVNSSNFQVSTVFCAMQSARLIQSFRLVDEKGSKPSNVVNTKGKPVDVSQMVDELLAMLLRKFTPANNATPVPDAPTPDNPFILGYTVSQKKPELDNVNPAAAAAKVPTPAFFVPKSFRCNLSPKSVYCEGTLNYCMLTHRASNPPDFTSGGQERQVDYGIDGAGRFKENVFARVKSKAQPGSTEGALFFCQDIFMNHWIGSSVAPLFYLDPGTVGTEVARLVENNYSQLNVVGAMKFGNELRSPTRSLTRNNEYELKNSLRSGRKMIAVNFAGDPTESMKLEYDTTLRVKYENLNQLRDDDEDLKRRLKFTIGSYTHIKIKIFRRLAGSHVGNAVGQAVSLVSETFGGQKLHIDLYSDSEWEEAYDANIWLNYKYTFEIGTSAQNRGSFTVENSQSEHMQSDGQLKAYDSGPPGNENMKPGVWSHTEMYNWAKTWEGAFTTEKANLKTIGTTLATTGAQRFRDALNDLTKSLGTTVILPAGDVFMFKGMSADSDYNVFTTISYDTATEGTVTARAAKDVSNSRWQAPQKPVAK